MFWLTARNVQRLFTGLILGGLVIGIFVFGLNYYRLQQPLNRVIEQDARNHGIRVAVYYDSFVDTGTIVFDVRAVDPPGGYAGLFRSFFQFAKEQQGRKIDELILAYHGNRKLKLKGQDFLALGASFGAMPPKELMWQLARNLRLPDDRLVLSHIPGTMVTALKKKLGEESGESQAASTLFTTITQ
jgi:hypothetical protein